MYDVQTFEGSALEAAWQVSDRRTRRQWMYIIGQPLVLFLYAMMKLMKGLACQGQLKIRTTYLNRLFLKGQE